MFIILKKNDFASLRENRVEEHHDLSFRIWLKQFKSPRDFNYKTERSSIEAPPQSESANYKI